jgi:hypothetical protein
MTHLDRDVHKETRCTFLDRQKSKNRMPNMYSRKKDAKTPRRNDRKTERQKDRKTERLKYRKTERQKDNEVIWRRKQT